jgi:hypothetical protein
VKTWTTTGRGNSFPSGKTICGQAAEGLYKIILKEEFARMNELMELSPFPKDYKLEFQIGALWIALRALKVWEYNPMACLQMIVQLSQGLWESLHKSD